MGTVVVTGIAGSLGQRVAERLLRSGDATTVIGVDSSPTAGIPGVEVSVVDLAADDGAVEDRLAGLLAGADGVIHLAWRTDDAAGHGPAGAAANHLALARVTAATVAAGVGRFVHLSSATVYGAWADNPVPLTEDAPLRPNPELAFAVGKADAERFVADWAEAHPAVTVAVLRPVATVGSPQHPLYRALGGLAAPRADDAVRPVQYLHVDDLADAAVLAWRDGLRGVFNVAPDAGTVEATARDLVGGIARLRLPAVAARAVASAAWRLGRGGVPAAARPYVTHPWVVAPDRLLATGWTARYSSEEALVATDDRPHWDDLPPGKRQNYTLAVVVGGVMMAAGVAVGVTTALLRRRRAAG